MPTDAEEVNGLRQLFQKQSSSPGSHPMAQCGWASRVKFEVAAEARAAADEHEEWRKKQERAELLRQQAVEQAAMVERRKQERGESISQGHGPRGKGGAFLISR
eukprot:2590154-Prymnesium_polylepis.1